MKKKILSSLKPVNEREIIEAVLDEALRTTNKVRQNDRLQFALYCLIHYPRGMMETTIIDALRGVLQKDRGTSQMIFSLGLKELLEKGPRDIQENLVSLLYDCVFADRQRFRQLFTVDPGFLVRIKTRNQSFEIQRMLDLIRDLSNMPQ